MPVLFSVTAVYRFLTNFLFRVQYFLIPCLWQERKFPVYLLANNITNNIIYFTTMKFLHFLLLSPRWMPRLIHAAPNETIAVTLLPVIINAAIDIINTVCNTALQIFIYPTPSCYNMMTKLVTSQM